MKSVAAFAMAVGLASAQEFVRCGAEPPTSLIDESDRIDSTAFNDTRIATIDVDTYVHVVTTSATEGQYSQTQINQQMEVMNAAYADSGFSFSLLDTTFTVNDQWARGASGQAMKTRLRQGDYGTLNLYFLSDLPGILGQCTFPQPSPSASTLVLDGCINLAGSLPGGETANYNEGATAVHEAGHWFGLYHVFQGRSCTGDGDFVDDTPPQRTATNGCPAGKNSCPDQPGLDSINNYMDYSTDACMTEFTPGQASRAQTMFARYRSS